VSLPITRRVDGLVIMSVPFDEAIERRLVDQAIPTVLVEIPHNGFSTVIIDHAGGGRAVAELFVSRGHRRFAFIGHRQTHDYRSQSLTQLEGFRSALPTEPQVRNIDYRVSEAVATAIDLLDNADRPTAIFAHDDLLASGVMEAARQLGLSVPEDLAIAGFNDSEIAEPLGLTTVRQPFEESGEVAMGMLLDQLADPAVSRRDVTLGVSLIQRATT